MLVIWVLTWILQGLGEPTAIALWQWFGENWLLTILLIIFLA